MRGCYGKVVLVVVIAIVAAIVSLGVFVAAQQGLIPFLNTASFQNRATIVLDSVERMAVLTTTRFNFSSLVSSEREMPPLLAALYGERQLLVAVGHVTAGIDVAQLDPDDVRVDGSTVNITLPPAVLQDCFLNESASYVVQRDTGIFARSAPDLEGQARQYAVAQFRQQAIDEGILTTASAQAQTAIAEFIRLLQLPGVTTINVSVSPPDPAAPLPPSCQ